jgi:hypothetical protein
MYDISVPPARRGPRARDDDAAPRRGLRAAG